MEPSLPRFDLLHNRIFLSSSDRSSTDSQELNSDRIKYAKLATTNLIEHGYAKTVYYRSPIDNKEYIIISTRHEDEYIYFYDIKEDCYIQKFKYPENFQPRFHAAILNQKENTLYLVGGHTKAFGILDLVTGEWDIKCLNDHDEYEQQIQKHNIVNYRCFYRYFIDDKIHVYHNRKYLTYTPNEDKFVIIHDFESQQEQESILKNSKMVHVTAPCSKLLIIGGDGSMENGLRFQSKKIWYNDMELSKEWKLLNVELQKEMNYFQYNAVVGFGSILFVFHKGTSEIHCLDLLITKKWYVSPKKLPRIPSFLFTVQTPDNYLHFIKCRNHGHNWYDSSYHIRISLYDAIPKELFNLYHVYYKKLVIGYIRNEIEMKYSLFVADPLKGLIANYFSWL